MGLADLTSESKEGPTIGAVPSLISAFLSLLSLLSTIVGVLLLMELVLALTPFPVVVVVAADDDDDDGGSGGLKAVNLGSGRFVV